MKMKTYAAILAMASLSLVLSATAFWEGTAVASSYGEFPQAGLYGACSSFPRNTLVEIENLENGRTVQVIVTGGLDNQGVFIALSPEASYELGIAAGMVARVRVSMPRKANDTVLRSDSPGLNEDPDLNPAALVNRERAKRGGEGPEASQEPLSAPSPGPAVALLPSPSPRATPRASPAPFVPSSKERPQAIGDKRTPPEERAVVRAPENLPLLEETVPLAVEAKTGNEAHRTDGLSETQNASAKTPDDAAGPEAIVYAAGAKREELERSFAMREPLLEEMVAKEPLATAEAFERLRASRSDTAEEVPARLAQPGLAGREKPETALERMKSPEAPGLAAGRLPDASMEMAKAEAPGEGENAEAIALERAGTRKGSAAVASLKEPEIGDTGIERPEADERLVSAKRTAGDAGLALANPELMEGDSETASADERLAAAKRPGEGNDLALADPDLVSGEGETLSAEERLIAAKLPGTDIKISLADPDLNSGTVPETAPEGPATAEERLLASRKQGAAQGVALAAPEVELGEAEKAEADERLLASRKKGGAAGFAMPDPDTEAVSIVEAENRPPDVDELAMRAVKARKGGEAIASLAVPAVPEAEKAAPEEKAVALSGRVEPGKSAVTPEFGKTEPVLLAGGEQPRKEPEISGGPAVRVVTLLPVEGGMVPEVVDSSRKSAEAAKFELAGARRIDALSSGTYYVQIGVFGSALGAREALDAMSRKYPMTYQEYESKGKRFMRLYVGPLRKDEGGIVLFQVKSLGYKDAFLKKGD
jgi:hypothetical protein